MGNPSAAQEPSMEEILASIRQIISEDGDGANQDKDDASADKAAEPDAISDPVEATADLSQDDADSEPSEPEDSSEQPDAEPFETASVTEPEPSDSRSAFETMDSSDDDEEAAPDDLIDTGPYENPFDTFSEKSKKSEAANIETALVEEAHSETPEVAEPEVVAELEPEPEAPAVQSFAETGGSNSIVETESPAMSASAPKPAEYESDEKLISPESGASVANAFSALTHTILSQNARTLDDLVSDMLQPMLKEWLDENLPTLVERMVKQEIDRMARGGR